MQYIHTQTKNGKERIEPGAWEQDYIVNLLAHLPSMPVNMSILYFTWSLWNTVQISYAACVYMYVMSSTYTVVHGPANFILQLLCME